MKMSAFGPKANYSIDQNVGPVLCHYSHTPLSGQAGAKYTFRPMEELTQRFIETLFRTCHGAVHT